MRLTALAFFEVLALAAGALGASHFVRRVGRGPRSLVVMVSVATWLVVFGLLPFFAFSALLPPGAGTRGAAGPFETLVLNVVPWALVASPLAGLLQGLSVARSGQPSGHGTGTSLDQPGP